MDAKVGALLIAPSVRNFSCSHSRYNGQMLSSISTIEILQAILIFILTIGIVGANILVILIINNRKYTNYLHPQPRYLLTSLALNDLAIGLLITPFGLLPALLHCWPYGEIFCQIQALLRGALSQQSAVILICMAVDRYICALHPRRYYQHSSKKGCVIVLSVTWIFCLTIFGILVLPKGYYFNSTGLQACEPFYSKASYRILSTCSLYFPTTMILMYCYGSSFHASRFRFTAAVMQQQQRHQQQQQNAENQNNKSTSTNDNGIVSREKMIALEKKISGSTSRTMAAISLSFIVMVTPWTIQEVVAACIGSKVPALLDFLVTWAAISNSFWNPFLYWLLNAHFRRIGNEWLTSKWCSTDDTSSQNSRCCSISSECDPIHSLPLPPEPPLSRPPKTDIDGLSEKYWGEILERTVSSGSLHALQRTYGQQSMSQMGLTQSLHISTSEPRLCEPTYHNIDCAKNQTLACLRHSIKGLPDL